MHLDEAVRRIKENGANIALVCGEEPVLVRQARHALVRALDIAMPEMNMTVYEERPDIEKVVVSLQTLPFMGERRLVVIKNTDMLEAGCPSDYSAPLAKARLAPTSTLLISMYGKPDKRKLLYRHIREHGVLVELGPQDAAHTARYLGDMASKAGLIISGRNAQYLQEACGGDLGQALLELQKLAAVCTGEITKSDIDKYVTKSAQYNVFKLHDYFMAGSLGPAKKLLGQMLENDPNPIGTISLTAGHFKRMLIARACLDARMNEKKALHHITRETGAKEWAAKKAVSGCRRFTADRLRAALVRLADMDFDAKQGNIELRTDFFALLAALYIR